MSDIKKEIVLSERETLDCLDVENRAKAAKDYCFGALNKLWRLNDKYLYTFKHRRKTAEKIRNKAEGYRESDPTQPLDPYKVTDGFGCRYVLLSQQYMARIVEKLIRLIMTDIPVDTITSPFKKGGLEKLVVYDNRPKNDPLAITLKIKQMLSAGNFNLGNKLHFEDKKSGYSSVHIVALVSVKYTGRDLGKMVVVDVPVEVQVRDVFEDAWSEFEHRMVYSSKDDRDGEDRPTLSDPVWRQHLNVFKVFVDGCSQYAALLHQNEEQFASFEGPKSDSAPLTLPEKDKDHVVSILREQKAGREVIAMVESAYNQLKEVQERRLKLADPAYQMLVEKFSQTIESCKDFLEKKIPGSYPVQYFLESERLLALMNTMDSELPVGLEDGYKKLFDEFPNDPILAFRKGQILCRKTELDDYLLAVETLEKALKEIKIAHPPSHIGDEGLNFLRDAIPVQIGHACGLIYEKMLKTEPDKAKKYWEMGVQHNEEVIQRRCEKWQEVLDQVSPDHCRVLGRAVNNILNFILDKEKGTGTLSACVSCKRGPDWDGKRVRQLLVCLDHPHLAQFRREYSTQDTVMVARTLLGERDLAMGEAEAIISELYSRAVSHTGLSGIPPHLVAGFLKTHDEKWCYKRASEIQLLLAD